MPRPTILHPTALPGIALADGQWPVLRVPAGVYPGLGDQQVENCRPLYSARVDTFWIDLLPVTARSFATAIQDGALADSPPQRGVRGADRILRQLADSSSGGNPFAVGVSFAEATAYACWRGARLPTETEWELALRPTQGPARSADTLRAALSASGIEIDLPADLLSDATALSNMGAPITWRRVAEWTLDLMTKNYSQWVLERNLVATELTEPAPEEFLVVRGAVPIAHTPAVTLRYGLRGDRCDPTLPVGFRCLIPAMWARVVPDRRHAEEALL